MPVNIAARRGAKNQRRKAAVAEKRKAERNANSLSGQIHEAQAYPIQYCLLADSFFDVGMGLLLVGRGATPYGVTMAGFLLDSMGYGVKNVLMHMLSGREIEMFLERASLSTTLVPVAPGAARRLLHDLVANYREMGIEPHRDYAKMERIFGDIAPVARIAETQAGDSPYSAIIDATAEPDAAPVEQAAAAE